MAPVSNRTTFGQLIPQLFLFPLLIVIVCVLVYLFVAASAEDGRTNDELIAALASGGSQARQRDAYELAQRVQEFAPGEYLTRTQTEQLLRLRERYSDEADFSQFVTTTIGRAGRPELSLPLMKRLVESADTEPQTRMAAVVALGLSHAPGAAAYLVDLVRQRPGAEEWEIRWHALGGLVNMRSAEAEPLLVAALSEPRREIQWSAACWLGRYYQNAAAEPLLLDLLSWEFFDEQRGDARQPLRLEEAEGYMIQAMEAIAALRGEASRELILSLQKDSRSAKVRNAAFRAIDAIGAAPGREPDLSPAPEPDVGTDASGAGEAPATAEPTKTGAAPCPDAVSVSRLALQGSFVIESAFFQTCPDSLRGALRSASARCSAGAEPRGHAPSPQSQLAAAVSFVTVSFLTVTRGKV